MESGMGTNLNKIARLPLEYAPLARPQHRILEVERSPGTAARGQGSALFLLPSQLSQGDSQEYITLTHKAQYILYIVRRMHWAMSLMSAPHSSPTPAPTSNTHGLAAPGLAAAGLAAAGLACGMTVGRGPVGSRP